ncbi:hypothetical protein DPMN_133531 [Dreissena polymorpha]|uniref:Uncharacterized protein n=1 Tax=Dreissena polymorpha TaxID=45954 RepID=A0A9D4JD04_DREPO|nr:hypothetical protein DPMN_133531 [Dreissena polymorpha]
MSLVQFQTNAAELQRHIGNVATGCTACDHETVRPFHAAAGECIFRLRCSPCNFTKENTIQCPSQGICGLVYDLLTRDHAMQDPTWSNVHFERLCNRPCEQINCYISNPGYIDVPAFELLDLTAMIQICTTNKSIKDTLDEHDTRILNQVC